MLTSSFKPIHSGKQVTTWEWLLLLCKSTCFKRGSSFWMSLSWVFPTSSSLPNNRPSFRMAQRYYVFSSTKLKFMPNFYRNWNLPSILGEQIRLWLWHVNETVSPPVGWTDVEKASEFQDPVTMTSKPPSHDGRISGIFGEKQAGVDSTRFLRISSNAVEK